MPSASLPANPRQIPSPIGHPALALFAASLVLRPSIVGVGPLATAIAGDLHASHAFVALLAAVPVLCMGVFSPLGPVVARRLGPRSATALALAAVTLFGLLRSVMPSADGVLAATIGVGVGTASAGALPSIVAKLEDNGRRAAELSGAAAAGIVAGATIGGAAAVPLANLLGGWRAGLGVLAAVGIISLAGWLLLYPERERHPALGMPTRLPWRSRVGWLLALIFGLQAVVYWGASAWLPGTYAEQGWSDWAAGALIAVLNGAAFVGNISVGLLSDRLPGRPVQVLASGIGVSVATLGFTLVPAAGLAWTIVLGLSLGAIFPLLLALTADAAPDPGAAGGLAAMMLLVGYVMAALGPLALGVARDLTGGFGATFSILTLIAVLLVSVVVGLVVEERVSTGIP